MMRHLKSINRKAARIERATSPDVVALPFYRRSR